MPYRFLAQRWPILFMTGFLLIGVTFHAKGNLALKPLVHAVLFYSPTCGHCHKVMTEDLPPLKDKYGDQLDILEINATEEPGNTLFRAALEKFEVPRDRYGVPALFVGDTHLVGSAEIPEKFPPMIETGLQAGGIGWPQVPGLDDYLKVYHPPELETEGPMFIQKFMQDPVANGIAVIVLLGMIAGVVAVGVTFLRTSEDLTPSSIPDWIILVLCLIGLGVAGYMSFIELTNTTAVCGPLGDCNSVQQSPFAKFLGVPVGVLGTIGYLAILAVWLARRFGPSILVGYASLAIWGMGLLGTLFAIYLTFLEPFVIGATCAWCITNSMVITLLMLASTKPALQATGQPGEVEE